MLRAILTQKPIKELDDNNSVAGSVNSLDAKRRLLVSHRPSSFGSVASENNLDSTELATSLANNTPSPYAPAYSSKKKQISEKKPTKPCHSDQQDIQDVAKDSEELDGETRVSSALAESDDGFLFTMDDLAAVKMEKLKLS